MSNAAADRSTLPARWEGLATSAGVAGFTTLRGPLGMSQAPFDTFNLGFRYGHNADDRAVVDRNRALLVSELGVPAPPHWLSQVHGCAVIRDPAGDTPEADAAVTARPGVVLAVLTADCLPVLFTADDGSEVAAAHAGWRGLAGGVLEATLTSMQTPPERVRAWLGPAAGPSAYEVGEDVRAAFTCADPRAHMAFTDTRPGHWHVDLYRLARQRLTGCGMPAHAIAGGEHCTISEPGKFFSHRRDGRTGRMASLIWIAG